MNDIIIEFKNFEFQYYSQSKPTLYDINLSVKRGEKILIIGPSGSGKSTLGHCINGLIPFSYKGELKGSAKIKSKETASMNIFEISKSVGTVLQDSDGQFVGLTVGEDIAFALENDCVEADKMRNIVEETAALVNMDKFLQASPQELSGGQKQRVSFAGVMVDDVDILLFDEPLANLDPATGKRAIELIDRIWSEYNKTVIIIEHRMEDVLYRSVDRIIVMDNGRIVSDSSPDELMEKDILYKLGIREPLYVTAMKYAGINVTKDKSPGAIDSLTINDEDRALLSKWYRESQEKEQEKETPNILEIKDLSFGYVGYREVIKDISFSIKEGEMAAIVGTNGAGKSTMAKLICGFMKPDKGDILFHGQSILNRTIKERAKHIGYVMQNPNQMICKPMIYDEVSLGLTLNNVPDDEIKERVEHALKICGLLPFKRWPVSALSYGQKKRVTIASMLVMNPSLLILDEPTAGQDYRHYTDIMEFLRGLNSQGVTIIMITHDMHLMLEYTPHVIVIHQGQKLGDTRASLVLTDEELSNKASLKLTSLYDLAVKAGIDNPADFVEHFISFDRGKRSENKAL